MSKTTYSVRIQKIRPIFSGGFPYRIDIFVGEEKVEREWTFTQWGARRWARKAIRRLTKEGKLPITIDEYDVEVES